MKIERIIADHLAHARRLTIPTLGTFIVRKAESSNTSQGLFPEQELLFSEFLKEEDGVLRQLLIDSGANELTAAGAIDRFLFEVKHALAPRDGAYVIEGVGTLRKSYDGSVGFEPLHGITLSMESVNRLEVDVEPQTAGEERKVETKEETIAASESVREIFEEVAQQEQQEVEERKLFNERDRKRSREVTQEGKKKRWMLFDFWVIMSILAGCFSLFVVVYGVVVQWRIGKIMLPESVERFLIDILGITQ